MTAAILAQTGRDTAWLVAAGVFALIDWRGVLRENRRLRWIGKPMTMVALIAAAVAGAGDAGSPEAVTTWIVIGLGFSLLGDLCLQMADRERWFVRGLAAFLVGHLAYLVACFHVGVSVRPFGILMAVLAVMVALVGIHVIRGAARQSPKLFKPVGIYIGVISLMVAAAGATGKPLLIAAAALFYISDFALGWNAFVQPKKWAPITVMVTYHLAQACFVVFLLAGGGS